MIDLGSAPPSFGLVSLDVANHLILRIEGRPVAARAAVQQTVAVGAMVASLEQVVAATSQQSVGAAATQQMVILSFADQDVVALCALQVLDRAGDPGGGAIAFWSMVLPMARAARQGWQ